MLNDTCICRNVNIEAGGFKNFHWVPKQANLKSPDIAHPNRAKSTGLALPISLNSVPEKLPALGQSFKLN